MKAEELRKVICIELTSFEDLARMAATVMMLGQPTYVVKFNSNGVDIYGMLAVFRDYYNFYGIPMFYYYVDREGKLKDKKGNYIVVRSDETGERIEISRGSKSGWATIPIINLKSKPAFIPEDLGK